MLIKTQASLLECEITDPELFKQRRQIIKGLLAAGLIGKGIARAEANPNHLPGYKLAANNPVLTPTPSDIVKNYTNYYEFTFNKEDSTRLAQALPTDPWQVEISGEVENPIKLQLEDVLKQQSLQEYIYRFRCVEAWSMVVPGLASRWLSC